MHKRRYGHFVPMSAWIWNRNEEIIRVSRLTPTACIDPPESATTIRTCTVKQRTFFAPILGIGIWIWICLHCTRTLTHVTVAALFWAAVCCVSRTVTEQQRMKLNGLSVNSNEEPAGEMSLIQFSCNCNYSLLTHNKTPVQSAWGLLRVCAACPTPRLNLSSELRSSGNNILDTFLIRSATDTTVQYFFFARKSCLLWDNVEKYGTGRQATDHNVIRRMRIGSWIPLATDMHSEYVLITLPLQQWLYERPLC